MSDAIEDYRQAKRSMQSIIDRHMREAFAEIKQEHGATPVSVDLYLIEDRMIGKEYANGVYTSCEIKMDGE